MAVLDFIVILTILSELIRQHIMEHEIFQLAQELGVFLKQKNWKIATAESCTGGGLAQAITVIPGSSNWFDRGFITYSNYSKVQMLGVKQQTLDEYGAVSKEVALEMIDGILLNTDAELAVSVTGIAGPGGGTEQKPVGTVYIAVKKTGETGVCVQKQFSGDRSQIRKQAIQCALVLCAQACFSK